MNSQRLQRRKKLTLLEINTFNTPITLWHLLWLLKLIKVMVVLAMVGSLSPFRLKEKKKKNQGQKKKNVWAFTLKLPGLLLNAPICLYSNTRAPVETVADRNFHRTRALRN